MAKSPFSLEGRTAVITGGGTGIGKSIAIEFARAGADVAVCSRKLEHLEPVADAIRGLGRKTFAMAVDVRVEEQVAQFYEQSGTDQPERRARHVRIAEQARAAARHARLAAAQATSEDAHA